MKRFTIGLPNFSIDNKGTFKNKILNKVAEQFPFFNWNKNDDEPVYNIEHAGPSDRLVFEIGNFDEKPQFYAFNRRFWNPIKTNPLYYNGKKLTEVEHYSIADLHRAMYKLHKYAEAYNDYLKDPGYDYVTEYGEPVRIYQNFIQIGDHIIPFKGYNTYFLNPTKTVKKDINIIMNIVNNIEINNIAA